MNARSFETPLTISGDGLMRAARVSRKTYNKCMKELQAYEFTSVKIGPRRFSLASDVGEAIWKSRTSGGLHDADTGNWRTVKPAQGNAPYF